MLIFRADGNSEIGSGHIMRCLSIADAGRRYFNEDSLFVLAADDFREVIINRGYQCTVLNTDYQDMESEKEKMEELIHLHLPSALVADSYYVTPDYLEILQKTVGLSGGRLVYMDDIMSFAYPCDILINYNVYGPDEREAYEELYAEAGAPVPKFVLGASYVPLRDEFQNLAVRTIEREARDILISTGGADGEHIALKLAEYLAGSGDMSGRKPYAGYRFHFIIGSMDREYKKIQTITKNEENIFLHFNVTNMGQLMSQADAAISAAGSTLYELCAMQCAVFT